MGNFKSGDKVVLKNNISDKELGSIAIPLGYAESLKGLQLTVHEAWDNPNFSLITLENCTFNWKSEWFQFASLLPNDLFEID